MTDGGTTIRNFILATAGHVDHGKSALVKALTGIDPDRLPEEKERGITIDLGFAHLDLPAPADPAASFHLGIVDVPGHEDFVKNMVAGVGSIDLALFIVAADDGWMPQTEEHLQILLYLGVTRAVVALTKIDLASSDPEQRVTAVRDQLQGTPFADAPIVKTSVVTGQGLEELKTALAQTLVTTPPPRDIGKPRLPVDRVFTLRGIGTVVTGTLIGGRLQQGQQVVIQPGGQTARIRNLQTHNKDIESLGPGSRLALNLPDVGIAGRPHGAAADGGIKRGEVITLPELGAPSSTMDALLEKSARLARSETAAARPLKDGTIVRVHHGSANYPARVLLLEPGPLQPGAQMLAQLRFECPVFAFAGDRFIVRDWAEQATLAGGLVLEPDAARRHFRNETHRNCLQRRAQSPADPTAYFLSQLDEDLAIPRARLLVKSRFSDVEIAEALNTLVGRTDALVAGNWVARASWWREVLEQAQQAIRAEHQTHPQKLGLPLNELRRLIEPRLPAPEMFEALLAELGGAGFVQQGALIRHSSHRPALPQPMQATGARIRAALSAKPFEPPTRKDLCPDSLAQQVLRFLIETGEVIELSDDSVMLSENYAKARKTVENHLRARGSATASDLRQALGTNRRIIIPLLERLDREGLTARQGDQRILKKGP